MLSCLSIIVCKSLALPLCRHNVQVCVRICAYEWRVRVFVWMCVCVCVCACLGVPCLPACCLSVHVLRTASEASPHLALARPVGFAWSHGAVEVIYSEKKVCVHVRVCVCACECTCTCACTTRTCTVEAAIQITHLSYDDPWSPETYFEKQIWMPKLLSVPPTPVITNLNVIRIKMAMLRFCTLYFSVSDLSANMLVLVLFCSWSIT